MKVTPVLKGPLVFSTSMIVAIELPLYSSRENTLQKTIIPHSRLRDNHTK